MKDRIKRMENGAGSYNSGVQAAYWQNPTTSSKAGVDHLLLFVGAPSAVPLLSMINYSLILPS